MNENDEIFLIKKKKLAKGGGSMIAGLPEREGGSDNNGKVQVNIEANLGYLNCSQPKNQQL